MRVFPLTAAEEYRFWLATLEDHACFIRDSLAPAEQNRIPAAANYAQAFRLLLGKLEALPQKAPVSTPEWIAFAKEAYTRAAGYYKLEGQLQTLRLANQVQMSLTPAFLNGTLNENQEFLRMLGYYVQGLEPTALPLWNLMELWLEDQYGHALLLGSGLDAPETALFAEEATALALAFQTHLVRNREVSGYLRFAQPNFPLQLAFAREAAETVTRFYRLLLKVREHLREAEPPNRSILRFIEHHATETGYFMHKLSVILPDVAPLEPAGTFDLERSGACRESGIPRMIR